MPLSEAPAEKLLNRLFFKQRQKTRLIILFSVLGLIIFLSVAAFSPFKDRLFSRLYPKPSSHAALGNTYYVSKLGNNTDGLSWGSAWSELANINWNVVAPGDTVVLDGGSTEMVYTSTLSLGKSGTSTSPITIRLSDEAGRNGKAVIFGGRSQPLAYCRQTGYTYQTSGVRDRGIQTGANSYVIIDGAKWRGITIYGHNGGGIRLSSSSSNITLRNIEVYDNGTWNGTEPDQPGINLSGANNTVERAIIHDNGQDAFQSGGGVSNFTLRESWLYNSRVIPRQTPGRNGTWNYCTHSDGIQIYAGGEQSGVTIERSVVGPGLMQGTLLGDSAAVVHNVTVKDSLFYGNGNANIMVDDRYPVAAKNFRVENVTSDRLTGETWHNPFCTDCAPSDVTITNSIFYGGYNMSIPSGGNYSGNCQYDVSGVSAGTVINPKYNSSTAHGSWSTDADFTLATDSPCLGKGSPITSVAKLLALAPNPTPTTTTTTTPTPTLTSTPVVNSASFSLQTGSSYTQGVEFPVQVMAESDTDAANLFVAKFTFPKSLLTVTRIDTTGSFASLWVETSYNNNNGTVSLSGAVPNPGYKTSGSPALLATVYFTSKASGSATFSFEPQSAIYRNSDNKNMLSSTTGTSVIINPAPTPTPTATPTPSSTPTPTPADTQAPTTPSNLQSTSISHNRVDLSWTASTDNIGVSGYWIIRDGITINSSTTTSYSDTTVSPSAAYSYQVVAFDAAGNNSASSNTLTANTPSIPDTQAPTAPSNLTTEVISSSQVNLVWNSSTDNIGVTDYDVYRDGVLLASTSGATTFGDTGLSPSTTYTYYIMAKDATGNISPQSNTATVTTPSLITPTPTPVFLQGDFNRDTVVNFVDLSILLSNWNKMTLTPPDTDLNNDGTLNTFDFAILKQILTDNGTITISL